MRSLLDHVLNSGWFVLAILVAVIAFAIADAQMGFFDGCNSKCHDARMTDEERQLEYEAERADEFWRGSR